MSKKFFTRILAILVGTLLASIGLVTLVELVNNTRFTPQFKSDFAADYVLARATVSGANPYEELDILGARFGVATQFQHPSPHPPSYLVLILPVAFFSLRNAAVTWLIIGLVSWIVSLRLLFNLDAIQLLVVFLISVLWPPIWDNLYAGQSLLILLLLFTVMSMAFSTGHEVVGGFLLGLAIAIKIIMLPMLLFLLLRRKFRPALASFGVIVSTNLAALILLGFDPIWTYYFHIGRQVSEIYRDNSFNLSAWTLGPRLFVGTRTLGDVFLHSEPLTSLPSFALPASLICVFLIAIYSFFVALKSSTFERSLAVLACGAILLSPVAWSFYLTLLIPSFALARHYADWWSRVGTVSCVVAPYIFRSVVPIFGHSTSFTVGLLCISPMFCVLLMIMVHHIQCVTLVKSPNVVDERSSLKER